MVNDVLTTAEAAKELGISPYTVRIYCLQGRLGQKFGPVWLITRDELEEFKANRRPPGRPRKHDPDDADDEADDETPAAIE